MHLYQSINTYFQIFDNSSYLCWVFFLNFLQRLLYNAREKNISKRQNAHVGKYP